MLPRRNILIFHAGALGDFVLSWPLVLALGRLHPQSRIILVTHASKGALVEAALRVESSDIEQGWHGLFADDVPLGERPANLVAGAHAIYSFLADEHAMLAKLTDVKPISLRTIPPADWQRHNSEWLTEQLAPQVAVQAGVGQMLRSIATRGIGTGRSHDGDIVIHPGSGSPSKCWPVERFVKLIERLKKHRREVRVLLGEVELERFSPEQIASLEKAANVRRPAKYLDLFNELRSASLLIANDSGPAHLGGIMGLPTVALFGATDPNVWRPLGPRVRVVQGAAMDKIAVADVATAANDLLGAS
jgi:hypothetical protein